MRRCFAADRSSRSQPSSSSPRSRTSRAEAGREVEFSEAALVGTYPMSLFAIPGSRYALSSDGGIDDNALRLIDLDALATMADPVKAHVKFPRPSSLFYGVAFLPPNRAF